MKRQQKEEGRQKETTESNDTAHMKEGGREKVEEGGGKNVRKEKPRRKRATRSLKIAGPVEWFGIWLQEEEKETAHNRDLFNSV